MFLDTWSDSGVCLSFDMDNLSMCVLFVVYRSARSLASSYTPTPGSYSLVGSHGGSESGSYLVGPNSLSAIHTGPARGGSGHKSSGSGMMRLVRFIVAENVYRKSLNLSLQFSTTYQVFGSNLLSQIADGLCVFYTGCVIRNTIGGFHGSFRR